MLDCCILLRYQPDLIRLGLDPCVKDLNVPFLLQSDSDLHHPFAKDPRSPSEIAAYLYGLVKAGYAEPPCNFTHKHERPAQ